MKPSVLIQRIQGATTKALRDELVAELQAQMDAKALKCGAAGRAAMERRWGSRPKNSAEISSK